MDWKWILAWLTDTNIAGISLLNLLVALAVAIGSYLLMIFAVKIAAQRLEKIRYRTDNRIDDLMAEVLGGTNKALLALAALLIGVGMLDLAPRWSARVDHLWFVALGVQIALWINRAITIGTRQHFTREENGVAMAATASTTLMVWGLRVLLWSVVVLAILSNLGINITALVASLGVGGIAIALAVQNILGDLFASLSIAVDKPFEVGDFIIMGDVLGSVEQIGLKTTRLRSLGGEQIILSNTELLKNTIRNYKRMAERRVVFSFGVTYDTTPDAAEAVAGIVKTIIQSHEQARFDRAHLNKFGASSLDYEVVYYVLAPDYNVYMDIQQSINLQLMRELQTLGVRRALPAQVLHLSETAARPAASQEKSTPLRGTASA